MFRIYTELLQPNSEMDQFKDWAKDLGRHFTIEDTQMADEHLRRHLLLLVITEMQSKTIVRYHFTAIGVAIIKKTMASR